jgi:hypothetical protein
MIFCERRDLYNAQRVNRQLFPLSTAINFLIFLSIDSGSTSLTTPPLYRQKKIPQLLLQVFDTIHSHLDEDDSQK